MTEERALTTRMDSTVEAVIAKGDLSQLTPGERVLYYRQVCASLGLNALTRPFEYIELDGKLTLYARRDCTDQLRDIRHVGVAIVARELTEGIYTVTARGTVPDGRTDESIGAVALEKECGEWKTAQSGKRYFQGNGEWQPLRGDARANAIMRAETKAKRRVTLSIVGLGWLDETEVGTVPSARIVDVDAASGELAPSSAPAAISAPTNGDPTAATIVTWSPADYNRFWAEALNPDRLGLSRAEVGKLLGIKANKELPGLGAVDEVLQGLEAALTRATEAEAAEALANAEGQGAF